MEYAQIRNGRVLGVSTLAGEVNAPDMIALPEDHNIRPGMIYDETTGSFSSPPAPPTLSVSLSASEVTPGTTVTSTVEVRDESGALVDVSGNYHVPILDIDGRKEMMLKVSISGGQGSKDFTISEEGIYTLRTDLIRPVPTAQLAVSPELIVAA